VINAKKVLKHLSKIVIICTAIAIHFISKKRVIIMVLKGLILTVVILIIRVEWLRCLFCGVFLDNLIDDDRTSSGGRICVMVHPKESK